MSQPVLLFASYAEKFGARIVEVPVSGPCTLSELIDAMRSLPGGHSLPARPMVAVNHEWVRDHSLVVSANDEVALIPPVAGG